MSQKSSNCERKCQKEELKQTQETIVKTHWEFYWGWLRWIHIYIYIYIYYTSDKKCKYINSVYNDIHSLLSPLSMDLISLLLVIRIGIDQVEKCLISFTIVGSIQLGLFLNIITIIVNTLVYLSRMVSITNCAIQWQLN